MNRDELERTLMTWAKPHTPVMWRDVLTALDEYTREVQAAALREAAGLPMPEGYLNIRRWLRDRADRIEKEADRG